MRICKKHGEYHWYGGIQPSETCDVCKLENELAALRAEREDLQGKLDKVTDGLAEKLDLEFGAEIERLRGEQARLRERLGHALAALRFIARTCIEDPDAAQFACYASADPPAGFAPKEDYEEKNHD